nr:hypothetical protein [Paracoccus saliphilus]
MSRSSIFGFGSFFKEENAFNDVDLLIVHEDSSAASCRLAILCKKRLVELMDRAHVTMLSEKEEQQLDFIQKSGAVEIGQVVDLTAEAEIERIVVGLRKRVRAIGRKANPDHRAAIVSTCPQVDPASRGESEPGAVGEGGFGPAAVRVHVSG